MLAPDFDVMFTPGGRYQLEGGRTLVAAVEYAGELIVPTGRIAVADPMVCLHRSPDFSLVFTAPVPAGRYPVDLCTVTFEDASGAPVGHRNAAARLRITDAPVASWEMGLADGLDPARLGDNEFYGYPVDCGTGSFFDAALLETDLSDGRLAEQLSTRLSEQRWRGAAEAADRTSAANVIAFMSGPGDGTYPTWLGRSNSGEVACFVTDFEYLRPYCRAG